MSTADAQQGENPWTLVETVEPPFSRGFVPTNFLVPADTVETGEYEQEISGGPDISQKQADMIREGGPIQRFSDPRWPHAVLDSITINPPEEHLPPSSLQLMQIPQPPAASQAYQHLFAQHDRQYQQVMHTRHEQFQNLDLATTDLTRRIEASKQKSQEIAQAMLDITGIVEGERRRWKEKLAEQASTYHEL